MTWSEGEYQAYADPLEDGFWELQAEVPEGLWRTASGDIKISDMTDDHLRNEIAWASRNGYEGSGKLSELLTELEKR